MAEFALGWLGWSEEQALQSDVNAILIARQGHIRKLTLIHGDPKETEKKEMERLRQQQIRTNQSNVGVTHAPLDQKGTPVVLTPQAFDKMFGGKPAPGSGSRQLPRSTKGKVRNGLKA